MMWEVVFDGGGAGSFMFCVIGWAGSGKVSDEASSVDGGKVSDEETSSVDGELSSK